MMGKKAATPRTTPGDFVSVKHKGVAINARFTRYEDRAVVCKLHIRHKSNDYFSSCDLDEKHETRAVCHPGDKTTPPDTFSEQVGMRISFRRTKAHVRKLKRELRESLKFYEESAAEIRNLIDGLDQADLGITEKFDKLLSTGLLVCDHKTKAVETV